MQHVVQAGEHRVREPRVPLVALRPVRVDQEVRDAFAHLRGVPVAGNEHEAGDEAAVRLAEDEQPDAAPLLQAEDSHRDVVELVHVDLEEVVARVRLEDLDEVFVVVARGEESRPLDDGGNLAAQHRHRERAAGVRARRVQPDEPVFADDLALRVVAFDPDVVEVRRAVHGRARVRFREHQQRLLAGLGAHRRRERGEAGGRVLGGLAQEAEPAPGDREQLAFRGEVVPAVAEEGEVLIGEPLQQRLAFGELGRVARRRRVFELLRHVRQRFEHRLPVACGRAHVLQYGEQFAPDRFQDVEAGLAVDLDVRPRFEQVVRPTRVVVAVGCVAVGGHAEQLAAGRSPYAQDRVHHEVHAEIATVERHRERVDEEGHVVEHDVDRGVTVRGCVDPDECFTRRALGAEPPVLERGLGERRGGPAYEIVVAELFVVLAHEPVGAGGIGRAHELADLRHHVIATDHGADHTVHRDSIGAFARSRMLAGWTRSRHCNSHWNWPIWPTGSRWPDSVRTT